MCFDAELLTWYHEEGVRSVECRKLLVPETDKTRTALISMEEEVGSPIVAGSVEIGLASRYRVFLCIDRFSNSKDLLYYVVARRIEALEVLWSNLRSNP